MLPWQLEGVNLFVRLVLFTTVYITFVSEKIYGLRLSVQSVDHTILYLSLLFQIVVEHVGTDDEVPGVEGISLVPSLRTKLTSLSYLNKWIVG